MPEPRLEELVSFLARGLVDNPDEVEVTSHEVDDSRVNLETPGGAGRHGTGDRPSGQTIRAIRSVVKVAAVKADKRVDVEVPD